MNIVTEELVGEPHLFITRGCDRFHVTTSYYLYPFLFEKPFSVFTLLPIHHNPAAITTSTIATTLKIG